MHAPIQWAYTKSGAGMPTCRAALARVSLSLFVVATAVLPVVLDAIVVAVAGLLVASSRIADSPLCSSSTSTWSPPRLALPSIVNATHLDIHIHLVAPPQVSSLSSLVAVEGLGAQWTQPHVPTHGP
ncbi:hypothetical protein C8R45DRAFT_1108307 [Mycena sanguinolenta]|nr:hypothetical protein C8R45DRAFT_1108307 [Mycena sanguinolenta]